MSNDLTPGQQGRLKRAATDSTFHIPANEDFSLVLLEAAKHNLNLTTLGIREAQDLSREVVLAFADCLTSNPAIQNISFHGDIPNADEQRPIQENDKKNDYMTLITAISTSPLRMILASCVLPFELEEAIVESLKQKTTFTTLDLRNSSLLMRHATTFGELLATGKGLWRLELQDVPCHGPQGTIQIQNGLEQCRSLKELTIKEFCSGAGMERSCNSILEGLNGNRSLEKLVLGCALNTDGVLLLNKVIASHDKLEYLSVNVPVDCVESLCGAVSQSRSLKTLFTDHQNQDLAISCMLQKSTSLQELYLIGSKDATDMEELAVGLRACKTLTTFITHLWTYGDKGTWALVDALIVNHNLKVIDPLTRWEDGLKWDEVRGREDCSSEEMARGELSFYLGFNNHGRSLLRSDMPEHVWPYALEKAGKSRRCDALYFFLQETPELFMR